jgi:hypothetical protein
MSLLYTLKKGVIVKAKHWKPKTILDLYVPKLRPQGEGKIDGTYAAIKYKDLVALTRSYERKQVAE